MCSDVSIPNSSADPYGQQNMAEEYVHGIIFVYAHTLCIQFPASIVGLPRESRISRALSVRMKAMAGNDPHYCTMWTKRLPRSEPKSGTSRARAGSLFGPADR